MKKIALVIVLTLLPVWFAPEAAAKPGVTLRMDRTNATMVDSVRMEINVSGGSSDTEPVVRGLEDFTVSRGGTSSRVEITNGKLNKGVTYTYFIQPGKIGTFQIGPAEIKVKGRTIKSNRAKLVVSTSPQQSGSDRGPVFIEATLSSHDIFVEEQTRYTLKLYRRVIVNNLSLSLPDNEHIGFKQLGQPLEYQATIDGTTYQVLEVRYALLASKAGEYVIGPTKMNMTVRQRGRQSSFDDFFQGRLSTFSSSRPLTVATGPLELNVSALPENEMPPDFSGLVGKFQVTSRLAPSRLKTGESATLTVTVSGRGNVNRIPDVHLTDLPFARIYGDQPVLETAEDEHGIGGRKTMKWALVPEKPGRFDVPSQKLSFFDPETGTYIIAKTPVHTLNVLPGEIEQTAALHTSPDFGTTPDGPLKKDIQQIGKDILPIHTSADAFSVPHRALFTGWRFWPAVVGPVSIYLMLLGGLKLGRRSPERSAQLRSKNAIRVLTKRCRQDRLDSADLIGAFKDYLNDRLDLSIGTLTADDTETLLRSRNVDPKLARKVGSLIRQFENTVYAGGDDTHGDTADQLPALARALEKEIR